MTSLRDTIERAAARALFALPTGLHALLNGKPTVIDGLTLAPELQLMVRLRALLGSERIADGPYLRVRRRFARDARLHQPHVDVGAVAQRQMPGSAGPIAMRHYTPQNVAGPTALLVFFHGGGFVVGDLDTHDAVCRLICSRANISVLAIDYRLAPQAPFPAAVDDACAAYQWARDNAALLHADLTRFAVGGDSAGGHLAAVVCQQRARQSEVQPAAQLLLYPATCRRVARPSLSLFADGFMLTRSDIESFHRHYAGHTDDSDLRQRPLDGLLALAPHLRLAPAIVVTAGFDPLRDEGEHYAAVMRARGDRVVARRYDGLVHGFVNLTAQSRTCARAFNEVIALLAQELSTPPGA